MSNSDFASVGTVRCDDRLIHGQIIYKWLKFLNLSEITIVSDIVTQSIDSQRLILLSIPKGVKVNFCLVNDFVKNVKNEQYINSLVLVENINVCWQITSLGVVIKELIVGRIPSAVGRSKVANNVFLDANDLNKIIEIIEKGSHVIIQDVPDREIIDVEKEIMCIKEKINRDN
ncbi:PTS sugar transporter subunit IIB [Enterococcus sp. AZ163]|uniref:PTS sugar transporter subunit IIB n=1 Tax=Enterococcus sp. AZ163 TaxID=2774638 RepID=UPI003D2C3933